MEHTDLLKEIGMAEKEIARYQVYEREGNRKEQENMLRRIRSKILEGIHTDERLLAKLDFWINEIKNGGMAINRIPNAWNT